MAYASVEYTRRVDEDRELTAAHPITFKGKIRKRWQKHGHVCQCIAEWMVG